MAGENNNLRLLSFLKEKKAITDESEKRQKQNGVSLVELIIVILVIAIISTIALMNIATPKKQLQRQNVAQGLKVAFERARFDSVKRRAISTSEQAHVTIDTTSYTLVTDVNQDGDLSDAGDSLTANFAAEAVSVNSTTLTFPVTVYFNKRGEVVDSAGVSMSPSFLVCNPSCDVSGGNSNANSSNASLVLVTPTGTVNLLSGGSSAPVFSAPANISNVPGTTAIKDATIINGN